MALDVGLRTLERDVEQRTTPLLGTIEALAFVIEAKDPYTRGHCDEVSWWAAKIAGQVGLPETEIQDIKLAAIVHDIGKINVPEEVLRKSTVLTEQEFEKMKSHAVWGSKILETLKEKGIARIVRHHHERYDGSGYPDRLQGEEIPLGARILAVAESFHCIVRGSRYKSPCTVDEALTELGRCSGTQLDPHVVTAFRDWLESRGDSPSLQRQAQASNDGWGEPVSPTNVKAAANLPAWMNESSSAPVAMLAFSDAVDLPVFEH